MSSISMGSQRNSKVGRAIFKESFNALKQDIQVLAIPFLAFLATLVVGVFIVVSWVLLTPVMEIYKASNVVQTAMGIVAGFIGANIHVVSQAAVMAAANERFEGRTPTVAGSLKAAFDRYAQLSLFGFLEATVGLVLRAIQERLGFLGGFLRIIGGLLWAVATYFALPGILFGQQTAIESIKSSAVLIKEKWGNALRSNIVASAVIALVFLAGLGVVMSGVGLMVLNETASNSVLFSGLSLIGSGVVIFLIGGLLQSSVMAYVRVALYRYATGKSLPGFNEELLGQAFKVKNQ
jgi:hypothetical protein